MGLYMLIALVDKDSGHEHGLIMRNMKEEKLCVQVRCILLQLSYGIGLNMSKLYYTPMMVCVVSCR